MAEENSLATTDKANAPIAQYPTDIDSGYGYEYYDSTEGGENQKKQLLRVLAVLKKYWLLIAACVVVITTIAAVFEARKPDVYLSTARIQVNSEMNPAAEGQGGPIILNSGNDPGYFTTQLQILEGSGLLRRVVKTLDLEHSEPFLRPSKARNESTTTRLLKMIGLSKGSPIASTDASTKPGSLDIKPESELNLDAQAEKLAPFVDSLRSGLEIKPVKDTRTANKETRLIEIEYLHQDPQTSTKIANAIADVYVLQNLERKVETNASASDFLNKRVAELQSQIRSGEERLINYSKDNQIISLDASQNTVVQRLADLNAKLGMAENERIAAESALRAANQNPLAGSAAESGDARTSAIQGQLTSLRQQLAQLKTEFTDDWPEVKRVKQQIDQLEAELKTNSQRARGLQTAKLEQAYREAAAKERELRTNFDAQRSAVLSQNEAAINYRIIQQEIDTNKSLLANLLQKSRETEVILNGTPNNVFVADRALVPKNPQGPNRTQNVLIAMGCSLFLGVGLAFLLTWLDDTVREHDDLQAIIGAPIIGMIPGSKKSLAKRVLRRQPKQLGDGSDVQAIVLKNSRRPIVSEAFNQVRTSVLLSGGSIEHKSILVTSGQPSEGKTFTSLNLARSLANLGGKVLLVDADLRCPRLHTICGTKNEFGLSDLLRSKTLDAQTIEDAIQKNVMGDLDLLPSGSRAVDPANLLGNSRMRMLFDVVGRDYKYMIIDSPPALYFADSIMLSSWVDGVVLVGRMNHSSREHLATVRKKLQDARANIIGVVMNDVPNKNQQYGNYAYFMDEDNSDVESDKTAESGNVLNIG